MGLKVNERRISIEELYEGAQNGSLEEAFGTGTAAVVSPVGELIWKDKTIVVNDGKMGEVTQKLYTTLTDIQYGRAEDKFGWTYEIK